MILGVIIKICGEDTAIRPLPAEETPLSRTRVLIFVFRVDNKMHKATKARAEVIHYVQMRNIRPWNLFEFTVVDSQKLWSDLNNIVANSEIVRPDTEKK